MIKFNENMVNDNVITKSSITSNYNMGVLLQSNRGFCNYIIDDFQSLGNYTNDNFIYWNICKDFLNISNNLKVVRPINVDVIANCMLKYNGNFITKSYLKNCYNPTVASNTLSSYIHTDKIHIIAKDVRNYEEDNNLICICSDNNNYTTSIVSNSNDILDNSLILNGVVKSFKDIININVDFTDSLIILILKLNSSGKYYIAEKFIASYDSTKNNFIDKLESKLVYFKSGSSINKVNTTSYQANDIGFENHDELTVSTINYTVDTNNLKTALTILDNDSSISSILSFEKDGDLNFVNDNISNNKNVIVGCYDYKRYIENTFANILSDYTQNTYYTQQNNNIIILNMKRIKDNDNNYKWASVVGDVIGWFYSTNFLEPLTFDKDFGDLKLLFNLSFEAFDYLKNNNINTMFKKDNKTHLYGNSIVSNKSSLKIINNNIIFSLIEKEINTLKDSYNLKSRNLQKSINEIYSELETILKKYNKLLNGNSIQYSIENNTVKFTILLIFKSLIDTFLVEIDLVIK